MSPRSVFITGCNRGIGLELVNQWLKVDNPPDHLIATCRKPDEATELQKIAQEHSNVKVLALDVKKYDQYDSIVKQVEDIVGKDKGLNLLINNAGILPSEVPLAELKVESMLEGFEVNCVAPLMLTKAFLPLLRTAADLKPDAGKSADRAAVIQMSTAMASISDNTGGRYYAYRCSKVALNMAMKSIAVDLNDSGILVMAMHPGWVRTDMGGPNGLIDTQECASTMIKTINGLANKDHGTFLRYNNTPIGW